MARKGSRKGKGKGKCPKGYHKKKKGVGKGRKCVKNR